MGLSFYRPAGYGPVDLLHQPGRLRQSHDHLLIVHEIVEGELSAPAILEPLLADLVAAHVKLPDLFGDALEVLRLVDVDVARFSFFVDHELGEALLHDIVARHGIAGKKLGELGRLQQVQCYQFLTQNGKMYTSREAYS